MCALFEIGQTIETLIDVDWYTCHIPSGSKGVVIGYNHSGNPTVEFENNIGGHSGCLSEQVREGKNGHCWYIWPGNIKQEATHLGAEVSSIQCMLEMYNKIMWGVTI